MPDDRILAETDAPYLAPVPIAAAATSRPTCHTLRLLAPSAAWSPPSSVADRAQRRPRVPPAVSGEALILALAAAVVHAGWNVSSSADRATLWPPTGALLPAALAVGAPFAVASWHLESAAVPFIVASSLFELVYIVLLAAAYARADVSVVYPIARGSAPLFVLLAAGVPSPAAAVGVVLVACGVMAVRGLHRPQHALDVGLALAVGITIAGYTLIDKHGIVHASAPVYFELALLPSAVACLAWAWHRRLARGAAAPGGGRRRRDVRSLCAGAGRTETGIGRRRRSRPRDQRRVRSRPGGGAPPRAGGPGEGCRRGRGRRRRRPDRPRVDTDGVAPQVSIARLKEFGITPDRELGQNFLVDDNVLELVGTLLPLEATDVVLEVGPGLGVLTSWLVGRVRLVHAIEIDRRLEPALAETLAGVDNVVLRFADALDVDPRSLDPPPTVLCANLPYNVATPVVMEALPACERFCVMVQREIADRLFAGPGTKSYGAVSVLVQLCCRRLGRKPVSRRVFSPVPNVDSALVAFERRPDAPIGPGWPQLVTVVRGAFSTAARRSPTRWSWPACPPRRSGTPGCGPNSWRPSSSWSLCDDRPRAGQDQSGATGRPGAARTASTGWRRCSRRSTCTTSWRSSRPR